VDLHGRERAASEAARANVAFLWRLAIASETFERPGRDLELPLVFLGGAYAVKLPGESEHSLIVALRDTATERLKALVAHVGPQLSPRSAPAGITQLSRMTGPSNLRDSASRAASFAQS